MPFSFCYAQSIIRFCFKSEGLRRAAMSELPTFLLKGEEILNTSVNYCNDIISTKKRVDFLSQFIGTRYGGFTEVVNKEGKTCRLVIHKVGTENKKTRKFKFNKKPGAREETSTKTINERSSLVLTSGKKGSLTFDQQKLEVKCVLIGQSNYDLEFSMTYIPKTTSALTSNGELVKVSDGKPSNTTEITTSVQLTKGQKLDIGGVVKDLNDKSRTLSLTGIDYSKTTGQAQTKIYLSIE